ncbi:MAG: hypothetical protein BGO59_08740 [Spirosoma sp. 48-14]|nr:MAG: hypothetical protein BGO59_08740 [Spirosoma sp. 48-14]
MPKAKFPVGFFCSVLGKERHILYNCMWSAKSGQMRVKREKMVLPTLDALKNMTTAVGRFSVVGTKLVA